MPSARSSAPSITHDQRGIDDVEESYTDQQSGGVPDKVLSDLQFRRYEYHRQRYGVAANFDAKANENTSLYLRLLWSGYMETAHKHYLVLNGSRFGQRLHAAARLHPGLRLIRTGSSPRLRH